MYQHPTIVIDQRTSQRPLHFASHFGHLEIVKLLLATGKVDCTKSTKSGESVLHTAARKGRNEVIKELLKHKVCSCTFCVTLYDDEN